MDLKRHHAQMLRAIEPELLRRTCPAANGGWGLGTGGGVARPLRAGQSEASRFARPCKLKPGPGLKQPGTRAPKWAGPKGFHLSVSRLGPPTSDPRLAARFPAHETAVISPAASTVMIIIIRPHSADVWNHPAAVWRLCSVTVSETDAWTMPTIYPWQASYSYRHPLIAGRGPGAARCVDCVPKLPVECWRSSGGTGSA